MTAQEAKPLSGPSPVTAEELEAIMRGGAEGQQQPKPRRKKQKTDPAAVPGSQERSVSPAPSTAAVAAHHQQHQQATGQAAMSGPGQSAVPRDRVSSSAVATASVEARLHGPAGKSAPVSPAPAQQTPNRPNLGPSMTGQQPAGGESAASAAAAGNAFVMPPPRLSGVAAAGQGTQQQPLASGRSGAAPSVQGVSVQPSAAVGLAATAGLSQAAAQQGRAPARPAESYGGSVVSDGAWGTEEERSERKRFRQEEKLRMK